MHLREALYTMYMHTYIYVGTKAHSINSRTILFIFYMPLTGPENLNRVKCSFIRWEIPALRFPIINNRWRSQSFRCNFPLRGDVICTSVLPFDLHKQGGRKLMITTSKHSKFIYVDTISTNILPYYYFCSVGTYVKLFTQIESIIRINNSFVYCRLFLTFSPIDNVITRTTNHYCYETSFNDFKSKFKCIIYIIYLAKNIDRGLRK